MTVEEWDIPLDHKRHGPTVLMREKAEAMLMLAEGAGIDFVARIVGPEFGQAVLKVACNHGLTCGFAGVAGWIWSLRNGCARPVG